MPFGTAVSGSHVLLLSFKWCHILAPDSMAYVTCLTGPMQYLLSYGFTICHVICMTLHCHNCVTYGTYSFGKCNIFDIPDEAMLFSMVEAHPQLKKLPIIHNLRELCSYTCFQTE